MKHHDMSSRAAPAFVPYVDHFPQGAGHWQCLALRDDFGAFDKSDALSDVFIDAFVAAGEPVDMAVFMRRDHDRGLLTYWFSPAARTVAMQWHAAECEQPPSGEGLSLLLGDDDAWRVFFPPE
jgi:hypothetical protein